ncbi:TonB-linked SusC/RagA family outer membrane protein [Flavobacterium nitrogenifigens]|uniref:TonB-linked SusC/RagA family outer membrane protein n=2 Tax=Flavobacterium TaxID=237 RepID=A0A7W7IYW5_9FLAO|nr:MULTISPECIES: TonB-dependent receptor [Flavobacterium]MBB4803144.1 TonB-linked SusC/RagA family outer membrane protein [Flavobacterium nitrogenifigens]MBB6388102.1 TonB-linked SusC/RagA family outer membrane protein [Flavobacterium notoginsengisoli]
MKKVFAKKSSTFRMHSVLEKSLKTALFSLLSLSIQAASAAPISENALNKTSLLAFQKVVKGQVVDEKGTPIPGVNVVIKGSKTGVQTDIDGSFAIEVPSSSTILVFSFLGMQEQEVAAGNSSLKITMKESGQQMDEVVVVGYSKVKKESLTGSLQTLDNKKIVDVTTPAVENMLAGKATGVFVNTGGGQPGSVGKIIIRGRTTVNGSTDPLWVIDGVIVGNSSGNMNPADIETLTVLKDAASTAVYGSQGANGVIVVTTKSGKKGKSTINFSARTAMTTINNGNFDIMNGAELYDLYDSFANKEDFQNVWWWTPELRNKNYDWWDNGSKTGIANDYNLSISGGGDNFKSYVSLGYYDETGAIKGYDYKKYNGLMKFEYKANNWLTIRPQINLTKETTFDQQHSVGALYGNMPWDSPYLEDGTLVGNAPNPTWVNTTGSNYLYDLQWNYGESESYTVRANMDFDIKLTSWLTFASVNNYIFGSYTSTYYSDPRSSSGEAVKGRIEDYFSNYNRVYSNQLLRFNKTFDKHSFNAVAGYEWNEYNSKYSNGIATGIPPGIIVADAAAVPEKVGGGRAQWAVQSLLSNINYSYDDRYLAQVSFRRDGASNFGKNAQYGNFFSVSGGWNIHKESFFHADFIHNLKLKASYGSVGNRPNSLYPHLPLYSFSQSYNENPGALISQLANADLSWEKTYTGDIGLDIGLFNRVNITLDYYNKNTSDLLYRVPLPGVIGVTSIWRNVGAVNNRGFEASINVDIIKNDNLKWSIDANIGTNKNKVTSLYGGKTQIIVGDGSGIAGSASKLLTPGMDVDSWYLTEWAGVDPENGRPQWITTDASGARVKTYNYADASKNQKVIGAYTPDFFGGFSTNLNYKKFDFAAIFSYSVGGEIYNYARAEFDSDGAYTDRNQMNLHSGWSRWEKPGDIATHPQAIYNNPSNSNKASSRFLETGTYLKMRSVTLGYNMPIESLYISNLRLYIAGENLFTITHYSGVDPEIPPINGAISGVATQVYPSTRKVVLGLNLTL